MIQLLSTIAGVANNWIDRGDKRAQARLDAQIARGTIMANDWKDEYWSILLSVPLIQEYWARGFAGIEQTPEWYQILVGVAVASSFGLKSYKGFKTFKDMK